MKELSEITDILPFLIPLVVIELLLMVIALVDIAKRPSVRGNKVVWILVIVLVQIIGPAVYLIAGRKEIPVDRD